MKIIILLMLTSGLLYAQPNHPDSLWHPFLNGPNTGGGRFEDMFFLSDSSGYGIVYGGIIFGFDSKGFWKHNVVDSSGKPVGNGTRCIGFHSKKKGWIGLLNNQQPLLLTEDSGTTWKSIDLPDPKPLGICGMSIVDENTMFGAGAFDIGFYGDSTSKAVVIKTTDGGNTFQSIDMSPYAKSLVDCRFISRNEGMVSGSVGGDNFTNGNSVILKTNDGGNSWKTVYRSLRIGEQGWKIYFRTPTEGYVALQSPKSGGPKYIVKTTDGGNSWKEIFVANTTLSFFPEGVCFADSLNGIVGGYGDTVFSTTDGGQSWEQFYTPNLNGFNRTRKLNDSTSYIISSQIVSYKKNLPSTVEDITKKIESLPYPNPAQHYIMLPLPLEGRCEIDIIDTKGITNKIIYGDQFAKLNTDDLSQGSYIAKIKSGKKETQLRFIVTK